MCTEREKQANFEALQCLATVTAMDMAFKGMADAITGPSIVRDWEPGPPTERGWFWVLGPSGWFVAQVGEYEDEDGFPRLEWAEGEVIRWDLDTDIRGHQGPLTQPVGG